MKPFNVALMYRSDGHLCKQSPLQTALFYMESSNVTKTGLFRGILKIGVQVVKQLATGPRENAVNPRPVTQHIRVDIKDHNPVLAANPDGPMASKSLLIFRFDEIKRWSFPQWFTFRALTSSPSLCYNYSDCLTFSCLLSSKMSALRPVTLPSTDTEFIHESKTVNYQVVHKKSKR